MTDDEVALKEEKKVAISGKQKATGDQCSFRHESDDRAPKPTSKTTPPPQPLKHEVEVRREKETSEAEASLGSPTDSRAKTSGKVLALHYFVTIGILPNVNSMSETGWPGGRLSKHLHNRRRRTREGPEVACVQTPSLDGVAGACRRIRAN